VQLRQHRSAVAVRQLGNQEQGSVEAGSEALRQQIEGMARGCAARVVAGIAAIQSH